MFTFHRPRVYRSIEGCCICRAKSSSSRFTDSTKYEDDSMKCFDLKYPRNGEICNACVLLVKRYKRLPVGSNRHWGHVVDARAGPGTKSITKTKHKKYKNGNGEGNASSATNNNTPSGSPNTGCSTKRAPSSKSLIPAKFSKIFKKSKKNQTAVTTAVKRKSGSGNATSWEPSHSLPTTPDSLDSDYEDSRINSPSANATGSVVQFQTQTRASSYRSRNNAATVASASVAAHAGRRRQPLVLVGSKRRKCLLPPLKNRRAHVDEHVQFYDDSEWKERKSCCGMLYECAQLSGAVIVDLENYRPCAEHLQPKTHAVIKATDQVTIPKTATIAPFAQLAPPAAPAASRASMTISAQHNTTTPVLKKHHLFFKRQSENFPHADLSADFKTELSTLMATTTTASNKSTLSALPRTTTTIIQPSASLNCYAAPPSPMPRHSTAKVATISPMVTSVNSLTKSHNLLHKIKSDTGKVMKHSLDKLNTAMRIKDMTPDMKHIIKTVDKAYLLAKSATIVTNNSLSSASSTGSSASASSTSTKFSDNSSDSGFDENLQDRKSASPASSDNGIMPLATLESCAQPEDVERRVATRVGGVQTMFLASGVQIQGQTQNLMLAGNEVAAKILQNRKQMPIVHTNATQSMNNRNGGAVRIAHINAVGTATSGGANLVGSHARMRAIYNSNAIQHENGVTTIVPASSYAASTQTAAMNAMAPSTVTITPAPPATLNKKLPPNQSNIGIGLNAAATTTHLSHTITNNNNNCNVSSLNQKIILVKTAATKYGSSNNSSNLLPVGATVTTAGTLHQQGIVLGSNLCKN